MGAPRNNYRRSDGKLCLGCKRVNLGTLEAAARAKAAAAASRRLAEELGRAGLAVAPPPPRRRTFEEQLALVAAGRARIVTMPRPDREPEFTLGGVSCGWMA